MKYAAIADWATDQQYSVTFMCAQLGVVRQGYYRWLAQGPCQRERTDAELTETIREIHTELHGHPGVRRVWAELVVRGVRVARKRVWRLMRAAGLRGRHPRAWKRTTVAGQRPIDAPDLIGQDFTAEAARHPLVWRHHLRPDRRRLGLHRHRDRPALAQGRRLRRRRSPAHQPHRRGPGRRAPHPQNPARGHLP